jgi:hypothetical protein
LAFERLDDVISTIRLDLAIMVEPRLEMTWSVANRVEGTLADVAVFSKDREYLPEAHSEDCIFRNLDFE